ncbi:hypothetical protein [Cellulomonas sp. URHB0016]
MADLPARLVTGGATFSRVDSDEAIACWGLVLDEGRSGDVPAVHLVMDPASVPEPVILALAGTVVSRFAELVQLAAGYLRQRLREPRFGLRDSELSALDASEAPFSEPGAVIWADGTWLLRFAESSLDLADPYGIGVRFEGATPVAVEDLSGADPT